MKRSVHSWSFFLPRIRGAERSIHATVPPPVKSRRILVIDDEPMVRSVIARLLEEWEFKVVEADNGRTGLALARKLQGDLSMV